MMLQTDIATSSWQPAGFEPSAGAAMAAWPQSAADFIETGGAGLYGLDLGDTAQASERLSALVKVLAARGSRLEGFIQDGSAKQANGRHQDMYLVDLGSGERVRISERRGRLARGCHLDWSVFTGLADLLAQRLNHGADYLIINRFGRAEAEGRGMTAVLERALDAQIPAIVGVRREYRDQWARFHGGLAVEVPLCDLSSAAAR